MVKNYKEYIWNDINVCSHRYLFPLVFKIIRDLNLPLDSQILDAGCGGGRLVDLVYNSGYKKIYGLDLSDSGIKLAKGAFPRLAGNFFNHDIYKIALPSPSPQKYDLIIVTDVLEHLYDPRTAIKNIYTWLNKEGYLILAVPYHGYLKNISIAALNRFDSHVDSLQEGGHIKFFSKKTLIALLNSEGFRFMNFYGAGRIPCCWKSMVAVAKK